MSDPTACAAPNCTEVEADNLFGCEGCDNIVCKDHSHLGGYLAPDSYFCCRCANCGKSHPSDQTNWCDV